MDDDDWTRTTRPLTQADLVAGSAAMARNALALQGLTALQQVRAALVEFPGEASRLLHEIEELARRGGGG